MRSHGRKFMKTTAGAGIAARLFFRPGVIFLVLIPLIGSMSIAESNTNQKEAQLFPEPVSLKAQIEFWKKVFTVYPSTQVVIHDNRYMDLIYEIVDVKPYTEREAREIVRNKREKYKKILEHIAGSWGKPYRMTREEKRIYLMLLDIPESPYFPVKKAMYRVRAQTGCADRFRDGIVRSGKYDLMVRKIFRAKRAPEELAYLPLVESSFDPRARSHAGAAGMWQFMPGTARLYGLKINSLIDERRDPVKATSAAAALLSDNYKALGSWPLAVTAYNHGRQGVKNAVKKMKSTDIGVIVEQYDGRRFSFASRNFYAEFLAAVDVGSNYKTYFKNVQPDPPLHTTKTRLNKRTTLDRSAKRFGLKKEDIVELNPALQASVVWSGAAMPSYYELNMPATRSNTAVERALFETEDPGVFSGFETHRVQKGETLGKIAASYGSTVTEIMAANEITDPDTVMYSQVLKIPSRIPIKRARSLKPKTIANAKKYLVRRGQTLSIIAKKFNTSIGQISSLNGIKDPCRIVSGQWLLIPEG